MKTIPSRRRPIRWGEVFSRLLNEAGNPRWAYREISQMTLAQVNHALGGNVAAENGAADLPEWREVAQVAAIRRIADRLASDPLDLRQWPLSEIARALQAGQDRPAAPILLPTELARTLRRWINEN